MRKKFVIIISTILLIISLFVISFGCTAFSPIVAKWQDTSTRDTIEFTSGGDIIVISDGYIITGKYELVGSDIVKVKLEGLAGGWISLFGGDSWQYRISGDTMKITAAGKSFTLKRSSN